MLFALVSGCVAAGSGEGGLTPAESLSAVPLAKGEPLRLVATTSLVADVVRAVGGDTVEVQVLVPMGVDPHGYTPTPQDLRRVHETHALFVNGFGLEAQLLDEISSAAPTTPIVSLSAGIEPLRLEGGDEHGQREESEASEAPAQPHEYGHEDELDPHVWFDPLHVQHWASNAAAALRALDPARGDEYHARAESYRGELAELDQWIVAELSAVAREDRLLVTDHLVFGYFAARYDFEMIGAVVPAYSSMAEPSAQSLADLSGLIEEHHVQAIFVGRSANPALAQQISTDLGVPVVVLYTGSLGEPGGPADSYLDLMRYNVERIVEALS